MAAAGLATGDAYYASVVSLVSFNSNGADFSPSNRTMTLQGSATISSTKSKFGGASLQVDSTGPNATYGSKGAYDTGVLLTGVDFTIEGWMNISSVSSAATQRGLVCAIRVSNALWACDLDSTGKFRFFASNKNTITASTSITANTWQHFAAVRSGSTVTLYLDGTSVGSGTSDGNTTTDGSGTFDYFIGCLDYDNGGYRFPAGGYIDEVRVTKGVARYTANFTPPTAEFPRSL